MLVQTEYSGSNANPHHHSRRPSALMDSPILARVERVILRHDQGQNREGAHFQRAAYTQSLLSNFGKESTCAIKRGLLWQQRDKLFSRWKERYFILTRDYLYCFRRASGQDKITEMGQFLFKVKLVDVERVEWENKRTYSTVSLILGRDGKIYLRAPEGLEDWFELIEECTMTSKEKRKALRCSHNTGKMGDNNNVSIDLGDWLDTHSNLASRTGRMDSVRHQNTTSRRTNDEWIPSDRDWEHPTLDNRLSRECQATKINRPKRKRYQPFFFRKKSKILTDIDINTYDDSTLGSPSITSYRLNEDVLCIQPPSLRGMGSFRSTREPTAASNNNPPSKIRNNHNNTNNSNVSDFQFMKFRERSYSDIHRDDRRVWRSAIPSDIRKFR